MSDSLTPDQAAFQQIVDRLASRDGFMAHVFFQAFAGDVSATRIARELGCSESAALRLALMRVPAPDRFRDDVAKMAVDVGIEPSKVATAIRQAGALAAFDAPAASGLLMAARDRQDDDEFL